MTVPDFAARLDGPWVPPVAEIQRAWEVLGGLLAAVAARPGRSVDELSGAERYAMGAGAAAQWTLGLAMTTPITREPWSLRTDRIEAELVLAGQVAQLRQHGWELADGTRAWLAWLMGHSDGIAFLAL
jgi:hypothetical protein